MSAAFNDGGPAFPCDTFDPDVKGPEQWEGMTLRDYFAAEAMKPLIAQSVGMFSRHGVIRAARHKGKTLSQHLSDCAYAVADAMLKARQS